MQTIDPNPNVLKESITSYTRRMEHLFRRWNNHNIPNHMQMGLFIEGLKPFEFMKEKTLVDLQATINRAKVWNTINVTAYYLPNSNSMIRNSWTSTPQFSSLLMLPQ